MDTEAPRRGQKEDPFLENTRSYLLHEEERTDPEGKLATGSCLLEDRELLWQAPARNGKPVLTILRASVSDLISPSDSCDARPSRGSLYSCAAARTVSLADNDTERTGICPVLRV